MSGTAEIFRGFFPLLCLFVMESQYFVKIGKPICIKFLNGCGNGSMKFFSFIDQDGIVGNFLDQVMLENIIEFQRLFFLQDQLKCF